MGLLFSLPHFLSIPPQKLTSLERSPDDPKNHPHIKPKTRRDMGNPDGQIACFDKRKSVKKGKRKGERLLAIFPYDHPPYPTHHHHQHGPPGAIKRLTNFKGTRGRRCRLPFSLDTAALVDGCQMLSDFVRPLRAFPFLVSVRGSFVCRRRRRCCCFCPGNANKVDPQGAAEIQPSNPKHADGKTTLPRACASTHALAHTQTKSQQGPEWMW